MGTGETIALVAGGVLLLYFFMKPATPVAPPIIVTNPSGSGSTTNTLINDGTSVLNSFINALT
jgi:hypothetical protein